MTALGSDVHGILNPTALFGTCLLIVRGNYTDNDPCGSREGMSLQGPTGLQRKVSQCSAGERASGSSNQGGRLMCTNIHIRWPFSSRNFRPLGIFMNHGGTEGTEKRRRSFINHEDAKVRRALAAAVVFRSWDGLLERNGIQFR